MERTPELSENRRASLASMQQREVGGGGEDLTPDDIFGEGPDDGVTAPPAEVGGMQCGGLFCPFVVAPREQCCTDADDVERGTARLEDRCGLSFANAGGATTFGDGCWQRDQVGLIDDSCEPLASTTGTPLEMGCCTDEGYCGTLNNESGVGCHYADGVAKTECGGEVDEGTECDPLGVFGVHVEVDVAWGGRSGGLVGLTDDGRAPLVIELRIEITSVDGALRIAGIARPCYVDLPQFFSTTLCESYKPVFSNDIWESSKLPLIPITGGYSCLNPGCVLSIDAVTTLIGMSLENPESPWPTAAQTATVPCMDGTGVQCFTDHDDDSLPGLTIDLLTGGRVAANEAPKGTSCGGDYQYWGAPLSASTGAILKTVRRADRIQLGTRTKVGGVSVLGPECMSGIGNGIADFVQSRAWGCVVQEGTTDNPFDTMGAGPNEACAPAEAAFMDENLPIYEVLSPGDTPTPPIKVDNMAPSSGPIISIVRLGDVGDPVSCEDVRSAPYPE